jgi:transposase
VKDVDFYGQILGVKKPWFVESVDLDARTERVDIKLSHNAKKQWACPECGKHLSCRDHAEQI